MFGVQNISRRTFLKSAGVTGAFVLGANVSTGSLISTASGQANGNSVKPNLFVEISDDGTVTLTCSRSEMGQGVRTGIPMILADELEADWQRVKIWQAPGDETKFDPAGKDQQNTDGSRSTRHHFEIMRELGAAGRYVLEQAAARKWGVDPSEVYAKDHRLYHTGTGDSFDFGEVVDAAADIAVPTGDAAPKLKDKSQWKYIGRDMPVVDNYDMSTGGATYGADISVPGMKIAVVARPPVYRGKVKSFDASEALKVQGVEQVIEIPALADDKPAEFRALGGVAVIGTNTWSVMEGRDRLVIEWDDGPNVRHDSSTYNDELMASARAGGHVIRDRGKRRRGAGLGRPGDGGGVLRALLHPHADGAAGGARRRHADAGQGRDLDPGTQLGPAIRGGCAGHRADRCRVRGDAAGRRLRPQIQARLRVRGGDPFQQGQRPGAGAVDA